MIALFEKKFPRIRVQPEFTGCEAFREKCRPLVSGGNPPHVFRNAVGFPRVRQRGVLPDLKTRADAGNPGLANGQSAEHGPPFPAGATTMALVIDLKVSKRPK